ncbi:Hint domain-containing protein [Phaeovulum vinaykumarii]|uniref:Hint domain-containing protein n=1 Tax=Phaeovulum vinaykumarii TaxID=407234 RepID=A0A1N7MEY5_9RHOB|nr:Hint domain-containing protein [Phaeovulum vinaykumarii]SIS84705.1 Hint domain-containing protein [Phaeovulum vinaykumarii]SOC11900.1 Hint domain-containing protein [Phaeovulum vinaykumarii]
MSYLHRPTGGSLPRVSAPASPQTAAAAAALARAPALPRATPDPAPPERPRARPLTRRYETMWLTPEGDIADATRIAPATPLFEEAFAALARGAVVATEDGPVAIEDLLPGMRVMTAEGRAETVLWIGSMLIFPDAAHPDAPPARMIRITADAFGPGRPSSDLVLGPRARLLLRDPRLRALAGDDRAYVPAQSFVDGVSVIEVAPLSPVAVHHVALEHQGSMRILGMDVESYHPGGGIETMHEARMLSLFADIFPSFRTLSAFGRMAHPRLTRHEVESLLSG